MPVQTFPLHRPCYGVNQGKFLLAVLWVPAWNLELLPNYSWWNLLGVVKGPFVVISGLRFFQGYGCHLFVARCWDMSFVFASVPSIYLTVNTSLCVVVTECSCWSTSSLVASCVRPSRSFNGLWLVNGFVVNIFVESKCRGKCFYSKLPCIYLIRAITLCFNNKVIFIAV